MKKLLLFTLASTSVIAAYLLAKNCSCCNRSEDVYSKSKSQRHLTTAFSKAKQQADS